MINSLIKLIKILHSNHLGKEKTSIDRYHVRDDIQKSNDFSTFLQISAAFSTREKYKCKAGKK